MSGLMEYLQMGGYAVYIWPGYGLSAAFLIGMLIYSRRVLAKREQEFEALKAARGGSTDS
jgi:heme exporter protein D